MIRCRASATKAGFTLIELSIVLVIIGLIVGGVLVGQDLIRAAEIRATITQIEKFNTARNTFYGKYGALPGDMNNGVALTFGFLSRSGSAGQGDGNGLIDGEGGAASMAQCGGETGMFWSDLSYANGMNLNLIEGSFGSGASPLITPISTPFPTIAQIPQCFPAAKLGRSNYFYVYETSGYNYYGLTGITSGTSAATGSLTTGVLLGAPAMSVLQAYTIDKKVDDGFPTTGTAQVNYVFGNSILQAGGASTYTATTCYNNATNVYATDSTVNGNGTGGLCTLSFRMQ